MSYPDPAAEQVTTAEQPAYGEHSTDPADTAQQEADETASDLTPSREEDSYLDDDDEWVSQAPRGWRVRGTTGVLLLLLFSAAGFWGGAAGQKHHDKSSGPTAAASATSRFAAFAGRGGTGTATGGRTSGAAASGQSSSCRGTRSRHRPSGRTRCAAPRRRRSADIAAAPPAIASRASRIASGGWRA